MADAVAVFTPGQRLIATSGVPIAAAYVKFYVAGSDAIKEVFADPDLATSLGSTVYCDSFGYPVTAEGGTTKTLVYGNTEAYKIVGYDDDDVIIFSHDNVKGAVVATADEASGITQDEADLRYVRNPNALSQVSVLASGDKFGFYDASNAGNRGIDYDDVYANLLSTMQTAGDVFSAGVRMAFQQTTPPTGWVKETNASYEDAALRLTTGTVSTGGSGAFTTVFASRTPTGTVGSDTPSITKTAAHTHTYSVVNNNNSFDSGIGAYTSTTSSNTGSTGGGTAHDHGFTGDAMSFAVKYADFSIGQKS